MAFILGQDEEVENQTPGQGQAAPLTGGQSSAVSGTAPGSTGVGKGGQGGFVNLQSYLNANSGDTGSASALQQTVGSQFGKEQETMQKASGDYLKSAEDQVKKSSLSTEDADGLIDSSAQAYSYDKTGDPNLAYQQNVDKVKGALTGQYSGPREYNYGFDAKTQEYGNALGKEGNFDGLLKNLYSQRTERPLSQGQYNLQKQLDVHNTKLNDTRSSLANEFQGLGQKRDETVKQTTEQLGGLEQSYRANQNALRDYLTGKSTSLDQSIMQQEADARKSYEQALGSGSGKKSIGYDYIANVSGNNPTLYGRQAEGIWGDNLTWSQLQKENDRIGINAWNDPSKIPWADYDGQQAAEMAARRQALDSFYGAQDTKYGDVADMDERKFNVLMDFLGSDGPRKEQGFQVRKK